MRRSPSHHDASLKIAVIFFICIGLLVFSGILLKLFLVLRASAFDSAHQYIVEVDESKARGEIIAFNPDKKSVVTLFITGSTDHGFGKYLGIPTDATIQMNTMQDTSKLVGTMLFGTKSESGMTIIDKVRLLIFTNSLKPSDFQHASITLPVDATVTEKELPSLFVDTTIYNDNESVTIVNATGESGIGSKLAHMLTTIGVNVISVITSDSVQDGTTISAQQTNSYTINRLQRLFNGQVIHATEPGLSDITLILGKKSISLVE